MKKVLLLAAAAVAVVSPFWSCAPSDSGGTGSTGGAAPTESGGATGSGGRENSGGAQGQSGGMGVVNSGGMMGQSGGAGPGNSGGRMNTGGANSGGAVGTGGAGGAPDMRVVAATLNGQMLLGPCMANAAASVCDTRAAGAACPANADRALTGILTTDRMITLAGTAGVNYAITLHIQGEVESKQYTGGMDVDSAAASPRANGFAIGGIPTNGDAYNVYMIRVTNPGATTRTDYFLNSLQAAPPAGSGLPGAGQQGPGVSNHTTYGMDYTATIQAQGGATLRLVAADSNCQMIKNCGPMVNDGSVCSAPITIANPDPDGATSTNHATFNFTTPYNGQWVLITVKSVVQM